MIKYGQLISMGFIWLMFCLISCNSDDLPVVPRKIGTLPVRVYSDSTEMIYTYNSDSIVVSVRHNTTKVGDIGYTSYYDYNENGILIKYSSISDDNSQNWFDEFFYSDGRVDSIKSYAFLNSSTDTTYLMLFKYSYVDNNVVEMRKYYQDSQQNYYLYESTLLKWDNNGNLLKESRYDSDNELRDVRSFYYDNYNNPFRNHVPVAKYFWPSQRENNIRKQEVEHRTGNSELVSMSTYTYNELNYPIEEVRYQAYGDLTITYYYDYE